MCIKDLVWLAKNKKMNNIKTITENIPYIMAFLRVGVVIYSAKVRVNPIPHNANSPFSM